MDNARTKYVFIIVGAGGTGSLLARDLPKLLIDTPHKMLIIDGDHVEKKNMKRQSYQEHDIGEFKAVALSSKINTFYDTRCEALGLFLSKDEIVEYCENNFQYTPVIIGCVDNDATRKILEDTFNRLDRCYYLDSANGEYNGNIFIAKKINGKKSGALRSESYKLSDDLHPLDESCEAQASKGNVQFLVTNAKMSIYLLEHCNALLQLELKGGVQNVKRFNSIFYE
jgi:molybdopterin/thiamine biosynthesis adenylyltransferase